MDLVQEIKNKGRFQFVADFVTRLTAKEDWRKLVSDYQVIEKDGLYQIIMGGHECGYNWMTAEEINSWFCRLPLNYISMQAEEMVVNVRNRQYD